MSRSLMPSEAMAGRFCWFVRFPAPANNGLRKAASAEFRRRIRRPHMSIVYVFAASGMEAQPVRRIGVASGMNSILRCGPNDVVLITGGMGPINARIKADVALRSSAGATPDAVLSIGLCGGLTA